MFVIFLKLLLSLSALAINQPLRDPSGLLHPKMETMLRVPTAKVILADYTLLKKDFPELKNLGNTQIDQWLLDHTAFISKTQAAQENVNTHIYTSEKRIAYRPKEYGRAAVFLAGSGLIDAKGVGATQPVQYDHKNGLATLGEAIREYAYEKVVNMVFQHDQTGLDTVGSYAVIDYGFDVKHADGSSSPAGEILRQAHQRYESFSSLFDENKSLAIEKVLRRYGITSAGAYHGWRTEGINIQGTRTGDVLDFGGFITLDHFEKKAKHFYGYKILLDPKSKDFIQPDPELRLPFNIWGTSVSGIIDPKLDNPWLWSHELANNLRRGTAARADAEQHIQNLLEPVVQRLKNHPYCKQLFQTI